jgi:hypothetical protein
MGTKPTQPAGPASTPGAATESAKVFLSYSRKDAAFADELVAGLQACGFEAYIDREDIAPGEAWETRLSGLIAEADTVVYVISPHSVNSEQCHWEVTETLRMSKRLLPVVWEPVPEAQMPKELSRLNFVFFDGGKSFARGLADLAQALRVDVGWIREHSRLGALARRWDARGRPGEALLRGEELDAARDWAANRPASAPEITDVHRDLIAASLGAREAAVLAARNRRLGVAGVMTVVALAMSALAWFGWQKSILANDIAYVLQGERDQLRQSLAEVEAKTREVQQSNLRLSADISLRAPPSGTKYVTIRGGWFPLAAKFSGAIAKVERQDAEGRLAAAQSGMLIDGSLVRGGDTGTYLLVPAMRSAAEDAAAGPVMFNAFVPGEAGDAPPAEDGFEAGEVPRDAPPLEQKIVNFRSAGPPVSLRALFPVLDGETWIRGADLIWSTPVHMGGVDPFELWRLDAPPPFGARPLVREDIACSILEGEASQANAPGRPLALYGIGDAASGGQAVTLFVSELEDASDPYRIYYAHSTTLGALGAPVFDLTSGQVAAVHIGSVPGIRLDSPRSGFGVALPMILDQIRQEIDPAEGTTPLDLICPD